MSAPIRPPSSCRFLEFPRRPGADLTLRSSDGVIYEVCSRDLASFSSGFPDATALTIEGIIQLSESSDVLDILLQLMRNKRPAVQLRNLPAEIIVQVAEAVEKYHVTQSLEICYMCMQNVAREAPFKVLEYAFKHDYPELADAVAPLTLHQRFDHRNPPDIHQGTLLAWLLWRHEPQFADVVSLVSNVPNHSLNLSAHSTPSCGPWIKTKEKVIENLRDSTDLDDMLKRLDFVLPKNIICGTYGCCMQAAREWRTLAKSFVDSLKPFSFYMKKVG